MIASLDLEKPVENRAGNLGWGTGSVSATIWDGDINDRLWQLTRTRTVNRNAAQALSFVRNEKEIFCHHLLHHATTCVRLRKDLVGSGPFRLVLFRR
jgi:hypothetical protein